MVILALLCGPQGNLQHGVLERDMTSVRLNNTHAALVGNGGPVAVSRHRQWLQRVALLSAAALAATFGFVGAGPAVVQASGPFTPIATVELGLASSFGALTPNAAFTSTGGTTFRGDTGSTSYAFVGDGHLGRSFLGTSYDGAVADLTVAYADAAGRTGGTALPASLAGLTFGPGVHTSAGAVSTTAGTSFTIDGQGHPDAVFIFQVNATLTLDANTKMILINGAQAKNVFWQVAGSVGIAKGCGFVGTLMANGAISSGEATVVNGRLLTKTGAIAMANNDVYSAGRPSVSIDGGAAASTTVSNPAILGVTSVVAPASVTVTIDGVTQAHQPVPAAGGAWSLTLDGLLRNGDRTVVATVTDGAGNIGTSTQTLTVGATPPTLTIDGGAVVATADQTPTVSGTSSVTAGQIVEFTLTRTNTKPPLTNPPLVLSATAFVQADQSWNATPKGMTGGEWTIVADVNDLAGNTATATQVLTIDTVGAPSGVAGVAGDSEVGVSWTAPASDGGSVISSYTVTSSPDNATCSTAGLSCTVAGLTNGTAYTFTVVATNAAGVGPASNQSAAVTPVASFVALAPGRLLETRVGEASTVDGLFWKMGQRSTGSVTQLAVNGRGGVASNAAAVVLNVAVTGTASGGYLTVYPCDAPRPLASNLNYSAGQTIANTVTSKVSAAGKVCIYTSGPTHLIADINGYFPAGSSFVALAPGRLLETRVGEASTVDGLFWKMGQRSTGSVTQLAVNGRGGVASNAAAAVLNVAVTGTASGGYLTVYPCDAPRPLASNLNYSAGQTIANTVTSKVGANGKVCIYTSGPTHLIADINGYFPAGSSFVALAPGRLLETRVGEASTVDGLFWKMGQRSTGSVTQLVVNGRGGVASDAAAVVLNVAVTGTASGGYLTVYPCGAPRPLASNLNYSAGQTIANTVTSKVSANGKVCIYTSGPTHLIADINGFFAY